jgi:uncharacterized protein
MTRRFVRSVLLLLTLNFTSTFLVFPQDQITASPPIVDISELQKKAEGGDAAAQFSLGQAYDFGKGAPQSDDKAYKWYRKAADQDYAPAQNSVGVMYRTGRGIDQNKEEAVRWYFKSARQGDGKAMFNLGTAYYNGDGVPINDIAALAWFLLAEEHGSEQGKDAVVREKGAMHPWQVASAFESVGDVYEQGNLLRQNHRLAIDWYRKAAQNGDPGMLVKFANYLLQQSDTTKYPEALESCEAGGKKNYAPAALCAGILHQNGIGTTVNLHAAERWFTRSAEWGNPQAMYQLAKMYWAGSGVKQEKVTAYAFVLLAANGQIANAVHDKETYERELTPKQIDKARKQAVSWARQHHPLGFKERPPATDPATKGPAVKDAKDAGKSL